MILKNIIAILLLASFASACGGLLSPEEEALQFCKTINSSNKNYCEKRVVKDALETPFFKEAYQPLDPLVIGLDPDLVAYGDHYSLGNLSTDFYIVKNEELPRDQNVHESERFALFDETKVRVRTYITGDQADAFLWNKENIMRVMVTNDRKEDFRYSDSSHYFFSDNLFQAGNLAQSAEAQGARLNVWISESANLSVHDNNQAVTWGVMNSIMPVQ